MTLITRITNITHKIKMAHAIHTQAHKTHDLYYTHSACDSHHLYDTYDTLNPHETHDTKDMYYSTCDTQDTYYKHHYNKKMSQYT